MAIEITIPRLGWSMDEGTFGEWLKKDGEFVQAGEPIFSLESEKALQDVESVDSGVLKILRDGPREGDLVTVGTMVGWLLEENENPPTAPSDQICDRQADDEPSSEFRDSKDSVADASSLRPPPQRKSPAGSAETESPEAMITPRAARLARAEGIDWSGLTGTGRGGRIREIDIRAALANRPRTAEADSFTKHSATRRLIADRMATSLHSTAAVTLTNQVDATQLVSLRTQYKSGGTSPLPAYHDIIAKLTALTLQQHPRMNCQWTEDGLLQPDGIHIGLAVDTECGLLVPVIRHCDQLSLMDITRQSAELIRSAQMQTCSSDDLRGGTFTITNLGMFGIDAFTPVINPPETGILGLGAIRREPVVLDDDRIVVREQLILSLTFDHRVLDGAPAARFLQQLSQHIENPGPCLIP